MGQNIQTIDNYIAVYTDIYFGYFKKTLELFTHRIFLNCG